MAQPAVLIVEDEAIIAADLQDCLQRLGYEVTGLAASHEEALQKISVHLPDLVLMDIRLKGDVDGIEVAALIRERFDLPVIYVTAHFDQDLVERAKITEPYGYIVKPIEERELHPILQIAFHRKAQEKERAKRFSAERELAGNILDGSIKALAEVLRTVAPLSFDQGQKLKAYIAKLAEGTKAEALRDLELAASLAPIGYLSIPATVIQKVRAGLVLSSSERDMITRLPEFGRNLLARIPSLEAVAQIIYYQNKNFDGTGFPVDSKGGVNIPLGARMLRILIDLLEIEGSGTPRGKIADQLRAASGRYDPSLLKEAIVCLIEAPPVGSATVKLNDLRVGQKLAAPIETTDGTVLVGAGTVISTIVLNKLTNFAQQTAIKEPIYVEGKTRA
jgi:response regulator RpfG family c-di-GMP phosphodiesterase